MALEDEVGQGPAGCRTSIFCRRRATNRRAFNVSQQITRRTDEVRLACRVRGLDICRSSSHLVLLGGVGKVWMVINVK